MRKPTPDLAYIALASREPERTATFLGDDLALPRFKVTAPPDAVENLEAFRTGRTALIVFPEGHPFLTSPKTGIDHIAIAAEYPSSARNASGLTPETLPEAGLNSNPQSALARASTCGVNIRFAATLRRPSASSALVERIDHIGIASADNTVAEAVFTGHLGAIYESRQTDMEVQTAMESFTSDKYGAVYHARKPEPVGGLRVSFLTLGDLELEFLENFDPSQGFEISYGTAGNTRQDQSAIGRFIRAHGGGLHHIAFKVSDIDTVLLHLEARGHQLIDTIGRPGSRRARIGFVRPSSTGGILFHFVERTELS